MAEKVLIGLDVGSSGGRCLLFNVESKTSLVTYQPWTHPPAPEAGGWAFDLETAQVWRVLGKLVREALSRAKVSAANVLGVAATSFRHGLVLLDGEGNVLLATPNKDARAADQGMDLAMEHAEEIYRKTGHFPGAIFISSRLAWLKTRRPEVFQKARIVLSVSDWLAYKMSGVFAAEPSQAAESGFLNLKTGAWDESLLAYSGVPSSILPALLPAGTKLGELTPEAAAHLGLQLGTAVALGGADTQSALLGMGVTADGQTGVVAGSTAPLQMVTGSVMVDAARRTWSSMHLLPGQFVLESNAGQMGTTLAWAARLLFPAHPEPEAALCALAAASEPGAYGMVSTIGAQVFNASSMGLPVDALTFSAVGAREGEEGRADTARAVLEGMAFAVRANLEQIEQACGRQAQALWLGGGMSRSALWGQMLSDVTGRMVHISRDPHTTALGAAICAGVGAGLFENLENGAQALASPAAACQPGEEANRYASLYEDWISLLQERSAADTLAANRIIEEISERQGKSAQPRVAAFRPKIYVSADLDEESLQKLGEMGEVTHACYREGRMLVGEELVETLAGFQVFVTEVDILGAEDLQSLPDLRVVAVCRGNPVNVDVAACTAAGIPVINTPARNADAVADLTVSFMLMLLRKLPGAISFLRQPGSEAGDMGRMGLAHEQFTGSELWHKTVGVVGGGAIGRKVIARLLPFGARVLVYDPYLSAGQVNLLGAAQVDMDTLLQESDLITLHAPVNEETRGLMNAAAFAKMKPGAFLVNTARAALVEHQALLEALGSGRLGGAALDVFPVEPPGADDPLLAFPNVIATPHVGGNTREVAAHQGMIVAEELQALLEGRKPRFLLNPDALERFAWTGERSISADTLAELAKGPGPGATDLEVEALQKAARVETPQQKSGIFSSLKKVLGGDRQEAHPAAAAASERTRVAALPVEISGTEAVKQKMIAILERFTRAVADDPKMAEFARGKNVVFSFLVKDIPQSFFLRYVDGSVTAGLGEPPREADVRLKMSADTLDGMFTGRVNAMRAATSGKLSFSGDTGKAMAFQRIQKDMGRLYSEARQQVGDPGDLTLLSAPVQPAASSTAVPAALPVQAAASHQAGSSQTRAKMVEILRLFTRRVAQDPKMAEFARGKNVVFSFLVRDMEQAFFLSFIEGKVTADLGEPPREPDVRLKMSADTLDGMFTGRVNAMKAAMGGKLSFSGDTGKAMAFQRIQGDMGRLYSEARQAVGDPGDLTLIAAVVEAVPASVPSQAAVPAAPQAERTVLRVGDIRDEILMVTNELFARGLITPTGGNISARCEDNPNHIWITPSAIFKGDLRADSMVRIDLEGNILSDTDYSASSERRVHCAIYKARPDMNAVIHSHAVQATLMGMTGTRFLPISTEAAFVGDIPVVPFIMPGTNELGDRVAQAMGEGFAVIMQNHGLVVAGSSLRRAADMTDVIEVTAHKILTCKALGVEPSVLPDEIVKTLREMGNMLA